MTILLQSALDTVTVGAVIASYGSGVWGIYGHFLTKNKPEPAMKLTSLLSLGGLLWFLFDRWQRQAPGSTVGIVSDMVVLDLLAASMGLFWWAISTTRQQRLTLAFSKDQPAFIHATGPYAWVRHPFYTSYILFWIATAVGAAAWSFWLMPIAMTAVYWRAIRLEEAKFATSPISMDYENYKRRTGMLLPIRFAGRKLGTGT